MSYDKDNDGDEDMFVVILIVVRMIVKMIQIVTKHAQYRFAKKTKLSNHHMELVPLTRKAG